jgi:hypothetical protein
MKKILVTNVWWITLLLAALLLFAHVTSLGNLQIDTTALALLAIMLLSPFASAVRRIKIGEFEAEIAPEEVAEISEEVLEQIEDTKDSIDQEQQTPLLYRKLEHITSLAETEPVLALVQLRIEIERVINRFFMRNLPQRSNRPRHLGFQISELAKKQVLAPEVAYSLRRVLDITNRAAHGEKIRPEDAARIIDAGISLLERLHWRAYDLLETQTNHFEIDTEEVRKYARGQYELVTITPWVERPRKSVRIVTQDELDDFLDGYNDYAEFIVGLKRLDDSAIETGD